MASAQGYVRFGGVVQGRVFYTAYYRNAAGGGGAGPGAGARASQWMSGVYVTEDNGIFSVALSSDNFLGAAATVANGDQLLVLLWKKSSDGPVAAGGAFLPGQNRTTGLGGTHPRGFKTGNGNNATPNFADCDLFCSALFTMTGQAWAATPSGVGGDANGDITLLQNAAPVAAFSSLSTNPAAPTPITRGVAVGIGNASADVSTNRLYSFNGQNCFEATSAAHNPGDSTPVDGSVFSYTAGLVYGFPAGAPATASYPGPTFQGDGHTFPSIDLYRVILTVKDDSDPALTNTVNGYVRTYYRAPTLTLAARQWVPWDTYKLAPAVTHSGFSAANANTINDVVRVGVTLSEPDGLIGKSLPLQLGGALTVTGAAVTITKAQIGKDSPAFATFVTQAGTPVRHTYRVTASTTNSITIDPGGVTRAYAAGDWLYTAAEPAGGTNASWRWEAQEGSGAWAPVGKSGTGATRIGTTVSKVGIGEGTFPGWTFTVHDGPARGAYQITQVPHDNAIVIDSVINLSAGDSWSVGCDNGPLVWPQRLNQALNVRAVLSYFDGWADQLSTVTQTGSVNNLAPDAQVDRTTITGAAVTYQFNGGRSSGTITVWFGAGAFVNPVVFDGTAACTIADPAIDTAQLRDGHAWLGITQATGELLMVFAIADLDRETPDPHRLTLDTQGIATTLLAGTRFKLTNAYEIEGSNQDNDVASYSWALRSAAAGQALPTSHAEFLARFDRADGAGTGVEWSFTYSDVDDGRFGCIELVVVDARGASTTTWAMFPIVVKASSGGGGRTRLEWD